MRVKFFQAACLHGKDYHVGVHEVPEKSLGHPLFHKLIKSGLVQDAETAKAPVFESPAQRSEKLAEKLATAPAKSLRPAKAPAIAAAKEEKAPVATPGEKASDLAPDSSEKNQEDSKDDSVPTEKAPEPSAKAKPKGK